MYEIAGKSQTVHVEPRQVRTGTHSPSPALDLDTMQK